MYVILVYDLEADRTNKMHKECGQYLDWKQNSLFEGELTKSQYKELSNWIDKYVNTEEKVVIYKFRSENAMNKDIYGFERDSSNII